MWYVVVLCAANGCGLFLVAGRFHVLEELVGLSGGGELGLLVLGEDHGPGQLPLAFGQALFEVADTLAQGITFLPEGLVIEPVAEPVGLAVDALPADARMAVYYADIKGYRHKNIAEIMDIPVGTVMSRLHRARRRLRVLLADPAYERGLLRSRVDHELCRT